MIKDIDKIEVATSELIQMLKHLYNSGSFEKLGIHPELELIVNLIDESNVLPTGYESQEAYFNFSSMIAKRSLDFVKRAIANNSLDSQGADEIGRINELASEIIMLISRIREETTKKGDSEIKRNVFKTESLIPDFDIKNPPAEEELKSLKKEINGIKSRLKGEFDLYLNKIDENKLKLSEVENEYSSKLKTLDEKIGGASDRVNNNVKSMNERYEKTLSILKSKSNKIDELLGLASEKVIAGDFEKNASNEKLSANILRGMSIAIMFIIVFVVGYSFWETTTNSFHWENSAVRIILAFILSVPAAYLARESSKHREQQYLYLQTSLSLKSIDPYIASLPEHEQHKIKIEMANRIFSSRSQSVISADTYPINIQDIIMEIIKKIEMPGKQQEQSSSKKT